MRNIDYLLINLAPSARIDPHNLGHHYIVNSRGQVLNPIADCHPGTFLVPEAQALRLSPHDLRQLQATSIGVKYNGSLAEIRQLPTLNSPLTTDSKPYTLNSQLKSLIGLLIELRTRYPQAKILALTEISGKDISPSAEMNDLRLALSELP